METQSRIKSPLFWVGLVSAVYTAVVSAGVSAGVEMPWWIGAIGVGCRRCWCTATAKIRA